MAIIETEDLEIALRADGKIVLRVPIGGRRRDLIMTAEAAQRGGTVLANAGFDALQRDPGFSRITQVRLKPFDQHGQALIELTVAGLGGPAVFRIDGAVLNALAQAAQAALELGRRAGSA